MKQIIFSIALLAGSAAAAHATTPVKVADTTISTVSGVGGYAEVAYTFAKGDKITIVANASKQLQRAMVVMAPTNVMVRIKDTKKINQTFEMPETGVVYLRFISDRGGVNSIHYSVVRLPASNAVQVFDTKAEIKVTAVGFHP